MKANMKKLIRKMPGLKAIAAKTEEIQGQIRDLQFQNLLLARENIDLRLKIKKIHHEQINVVFVCHRPAVWGSLHSVYDALKADDRFNVTIVAIPNKKELPNSWLYHEEYESEGAEEFWKAYGCINGYNYETKEWLDLRSLKPDYVFLQQPYNITRPKEYKSISISRYAKLAYVAYFSPIVLDDTYEESTPLDFLCDLSYFFTQHDDDDAFIRNRYHDIRHICRIEKTGCPRFDNIDQYKHADCDIWNQRDSFKVLWTPRWTTDEGNCHFFSYKDMLFDFCGKSKDIELVFRPHPQAFISWAANGQMPPEEQDLFRKQFQGGNLHLDESKDYYPLIFSSDCLITDRSTMIVDYMCTQKPIIYCGSKGVHDAVIKGLEKALYKVESWEELKKIMIDLKNGIDPLKKARNEVYSDFLKIGSTHAADKIKEILLEDAMK